MRRGQTHRHTHRRVRPLYISRRLRLTRNVISSKSPVLTVLVCCLCLQAICRYYRSTFPAAAAAAAAVPRCVVTLLSSRCISHRHAATGWYAYQVSWMHMHRFDFTVLWQLLSTNLMIWLEQSLWCRCVCVCVHEDSNFWTKWLLAYWFTLTVSRSVRKWRL